MAISSLEQLNRCKQLWGWIKEGTANAQAIYEYSQIAPDLRYAVENQLSIALLLNTPFQQEKQMPTNQEINANTIKECMLQIEQIDVALRDITVLARHFIGDTRSEYLSWLNSSSNGRNVANFLHAQRDVLKGQINNLLGNPIK